MLLPPNYLDSVISIETQSEIDQYQCVATGFLVGFPISTDNGQSMYRIYLVTNRHVFRGQKVVFLRFNTESSSKRYPLDLINKRGEETWSAHPHPAVDLAVVPIAVDKLKEDGISFKFIQEENFAYSEVIKSEGISQGDGVYVLGFPMGMAGTVKNYVIVRGGTIARLDDEIIENEKGFLVDAAIFPGNSGGPVFLKPELASIEGTKAVTKSYILGVIKSYIPYIETAYSLQSGVPKPKVEFSENSGLAFTVPMDFVREIVHSLMPKKKSEIKKQALSTDEQAVDKA